MNLSNYKKYFFLISLFLINFFPNSLYSIENDLDDVIDDIADNISKPFALIKWRENPVKLGVIAFTTSDNKLTKFGFLIADKLNRALMDKCKGLCAKGITIVERSEIEKLASTEKNFYTLSPKEKAKVINVDIIVKGSYTRLQDYIEITADAIEVKNSKVISSADEKLKDSYKFIGMFEEIESSSPKKVASIKEKILIEGNSALTPLTLKWKEEFEKIYKEVNIEISESSIPIVINDISTEKADIGMLIRRLNKEEVEKGLKEIKVAKNAVLPIVNENNPFIILILKKGMTQNTFIDLWINGKISKWSAIYPEITSSEIINIYTHSEFCESGESLGKYLGTKQLDIKGISIYGDLTISEAIKKDILGIGYSNFNYIYDLKTHKEILGLKVVPIDINNNGQIDKEENFYETQDNFIEAINKGIYPPSLIFDLHFVIKTKPKEIVVRFLKWVLSEGQKYVKESGYINLSDKQVEEELNKLYLY